MFEWFTVSTITKALRGAEQPIRDQLGVRSDQLAFKKATKAAVKAVKTSDPTIAAELFDRPFIKTQTAPLMAKYLLGTSRDQLVAEMSQAWSDEFGASLRNANRERATVETAVGLFLDTLERGLARWGPTHQTLSLRAASAAAHHLSEISSAVSGREQPTSELTYLEWLISRNTYLDARGTLQTQRQVQLRLRDIYVSLAATKPNSIDADRTHSSRSLHLGTVASESSELSRVVVENQNVAILGDPGGGKSTLVRYLALHHAESIVARIAHHGEHGQTRFPILVRVAAIVEQRSWKEQSLLKSIVAALETIECPTLGLEALISRRLEEGSSLILLDGLDEVPDATDRRTVVAKIEDFTRRYVDAGNCFIVTSRIAGYREAALGVRAEHFVIRDMNQTQQQAFLEKWCRAVEDFQTPDSDDATREAVAVREITAITAAIKQSPGVAALSVNPLLLRILALIHRTGARLPDRRIELYKLAADTLSQTWRVAQGVPESALVDEQVLTRVLSTLAYWMHVEQPSGTAPYPEVFGILAQEWCSIKAVEWDQDDPNPDAIKQVETFLGQVREQTGLFVEKSPRQYGFMHLTFEEYYAARQLIRRPSRTGEQIRKHLHDPRWQEPILLALAFVGLEYPDESSELVRTGVLAEDGSFQPSLWEEYLHQDLAFSLTCISDGVPVSTVLTDRLIRRAVNAIRESPTLQLGSPYANFARSLRAVIAAHPKFDPRPELTRQLHDPQRGPAALKVLSAVTHPKDQYELSLRIFNDTQLPTAIRDAALRLPAGRVEEPPAEWLRTVIDLIIAGDTEFLLAAMESLATFEEFDGIHPWNELDKALAPHLLDPNSPAFTQAREVACVIPLSTDTPAAVEIVRDILNDTDQPESIRSRAASAVAYNFTGSELLAELAFYCIDSEDPPFEVSYNFGVAYARRASTLPPITELVPEFLLTQYESSDIAVPDSDSEDGESEELLRRLRGATSDGAACFYVGVLAELRPPVEWIGEFLDRFDDFGIATRRMLLSVAHGVQPTDHLTRTLLRDPDAGIRKNALLLRSRSGMLELPELEALLDDEDSTVRATAFRFALQGDARTETMKLALADSDGEVRATVWSREDLIGLIPDLKSSLMVALGPDSQPWERSAALRQITRSHVQELDLRPLLEAVPLDADHFSFDAWFRAQMLLGNEAAFSYALNHHDRIQFLAGEYAQIFATASDDSLTCVDVLSAEINQALAKDKVLIAVRLIGVLPDIVSTDARERERLLARLDTLFVSWLGRPERTVADAAWAAMSAISQVGWAGNG